MNLTETQKRIINELTNEFETINHQFNTGIGKHKLFNPTPIVNNELENVRQVKELEVHNKAMSEQAQQMFRDIRDILNDDLKDTPMVCIEKKNVHSHKTYALEIAPLDKYGKPRNLCALNSLTIYIELETKHVGIGTKSYHKCIGFKFGSSDNYFNTIEGFTNSDYFKRKFGEIYNGYCIPRT